MPALTDLVIGPAAIATSRHWGGICGDRVLVITVYQSEVRK